LVPRISSDSRHLWVLVEGSGVGPEETRALRPRISAVFHRHPRALVHQRASAPNRIGLMHRANENPGLVTTENPGFIPSN